MPRMTPEERFAKAEENAAKAERYINQLRRVAAAEAEIPSIWDTGQVSKKKLALTYNISVATVTRILHDAGRPVTRHRTLRPEDKAEICSLHKASVPIDQIVAHIGVSRNTVRRVLLDAKLVTKGQRRTRRTDEDYEMIRAADDELRARFGGAGLYNLGMGLRQYDAKLRARQADVRDPLPSPPLPVDGEGDEIPPPLYVAPEEPVEAPVEQPVPEDEVQQWTYTGEDDNGSSNEGSPEPPPEPKIKPAPKPAPPPPGIGENIPPRNDDDRPVIAGPFSKAGPSEENVSY